MEKFDFNDDYDSSSVLCLCIYLHFLLTIFYTAMNIFLLSIPKVNSNPTPWNEVNEIEP
jgi:hypothetical protein